MDDNGEVVSVTDAIAQEKTPQTLYDCPHEECEAPKSVRIVGEAVSVSRDPLGFCLTCNEWTIDNPPDVLIGGPTGLVARLGTQHRSVEIVISPEGEQLGLGHFAGKF